MGEYVSQKDLGTFWDSPVRENENEAFIFPCFEKVCQTESMLRHTYLSFGKERGRHKLTLENVDFLKFSIRFKLLILLNQRSTYLHECN